MRKKSDLSLNRKKGRKRLLTRETTLSLIERSPFSKRARIGIPSPAKAIFFRPGDIKFQTPRKTPKKMLAVSPAVNAKFHTPRRVLVTLSKENSKAPSVEKKGRIKLFSDETKFAEEIFEAAFSELQEEAWEENPDLKEIIELAPCVLNELKNHKVDDVILSFFRQVANGDFHCENISFLLWVETVRWFNLNNSSAMRYMDSTKKFWKLGWRLFGGKFIHFMTGYKNATDVTFGEATRGSCDPRKSDLNFAVPDLSVLRNFSPYGTESSAARKPGIYPDIMKEIANALKDGSACLSFDGKKLKQGLNQNSGDIDILGFEDGESLQQRQQQMKSEVQSVENILSYMKDIDDLKSSADLAKNQKDNLISALKSSIGILGRYTKKCRKVKETKEYAKAKFIERSGEDWRHGQYVYVISAINALLFDISCFMTAYEKTIERICQVVVRLQASDSCYFRQKNVILRNCSNYRGLDEEDVQSSDTRKIKQRTEKWHEIRSEAKVTGSTIYCAVGLDGLKQLQNHFDKVICKVPEKEKSGEVMSYLKYGTENEVNAVATVVAKIMPVLFPDLCFFEEGCICFDYEGKKFMVVSPDGSLRKVDSCKTEDVMGIEIKCPVNKAQDKIPERYMLQCYSEMEALQVESLLYISWRPDFTSVFQVMHNESILSNALMESIALFGCEKPKKPTKPSEKVAELRQDIQNECKKARFIGEFPSAFAVDDASSVYANQMQCNTIEYGDIKELVSDISKLISEGYEIQRQKASEAMVFLCCDLDRNWSKDNFRWAPVCWFPKGYSLTTATCRNIVETVRDKCYSEGIHVPCSSFDGQWHNIAMRDVNGKPLTIFQLQKDVWNETIKKQKTKIVQEFENLNKIYIHEKDVNGVIVATNNGIRLPKFTSMGWTRNDKSKGQNNQVDTQNSDEQQDIFLTDVVPDEVLEGDPCQVDGINPIVAQRISVDSNTADEIAGCNITHSSWIDNITNPPQEQDRNRDDLTQAIDSLYASAEESTGHSAEVRSDDKVSESLLKPTQLSNEDAASILNLLRTDKNANKKGFWDNQNTEFIKSIFQSEKVLGQLRDVDFKVILKYLKSKKMTDIKLSVPRKTKLLHLCDIFRLSHPDNVTKLATRKKYQVKSLKDLSRKILAGKNVPKMALNVAYAEYVWPNSLQKWRESSPLKDEVKISDTDFPDYWFYIPEQSEKRQQLEVSCIDSSHLLTRTRRKICKGGIEKLSNQPWLNAALTKKTSLTLIMVQDIVDPMSVPMAVAHFSAEVERIMVENRDMEAASLCHDIRCWWRSEDDPGISALDRVRMRMPLRTRLLKYVNFDKFPPPTVNIKGWPIQLWEAIVANIDAKAILYSLSHTGSYNVRAFSSMMGETFFSEVTNMDKRGGHGTLTVDEFGQFMGYSIEQMCMRLDSDRSFVYRTSRSTVYNLVENESIEESAVIAASAFGPRQNVTEPIYAKDHFFDTHERNRTQGKKRIATISLDRNAVQKGTLGVRWDKARVNESKMLLTKKMGLNMDGTEML